ncbi:ral-GDS-related protein-like [Manis javanica]|uniref:ral-GDS-related protein-like n=1 Tax=Manis javanica TaxID=9974 RepID=UPI003C6CD7CF
MEVREAKRDSLPARCGRWLRDHLQRLCLCCPRNPEHEEESTLRGNKVHRRRAPWTGVRKKWRMRTARVEPARNISWRTPESSLPPEDTDQSSTGQQATRPSPSHGMGRARRQAWEPGDVTSVVQGTQLSSIPEGQALHCLVQEEHLGPTVAELEDPAEPDDVPAVTSAPVTGPELEPARMASGLAVPEPAPEPTRPCAVSTHVVSGEKEPTILAFPHRLVAEQLTLMYAELLTKGAVTNCMTYFGCQSYNGNILHLAPTVYKIFRKFDDVANFVISSCLGAPSMTAQDRAQVVEFWIRVAKECLDLKTFASLHAILLALQSPAVGRLKCTWGHVSWKISRMHKRLMQEKWLNRKWLFTECSIVREIMTYKHMAKMHHLEPEEHFRSFFQAVETLDEQESYTLSCQLEAPGQRASTKGLLFFRSHNI